MRKDTLIVCLSDMHSAGSTSLFPNHQMQFKSGTNHTPTREQVRMYQHWLTCADYVQTMREGKRVFIVHNGDAVDGRHHDSRQIVTYDPDEQRGIHCELMDTFMRACSFDRANDDRLYYVKGTEVHVGDQEDAIGEDLNAEPTRDGLHAFKVLDLDVNERLVRCLHHGKGKGDGPNEGNAERNWLRNIYDQSLKNKKRVPDLLITGHTHQPYYGNYCAMEGCNVRIVHGMILPSWQAKTRFALEKVPIAVNVIGAAFITITEDGDILRPTFLTMETEEAELVTA